MEVVFLMENKEVSEKWSETAKELKREYYKEWRSKPENKKKIKQSQQRYWERKALEQLTGKQ